MPLFVGIYFIKNTLSDLHTLRCLALRFWAVVGGLFYGVASRSVLGRASNMRPEKKNTTVCICTKPKIAGMYIVSIFEVSVYIKKYQNKGRGKEKLNKKVSTFTLFSLIL